ncbi:MAG: hypothetical protein HOC24_10955 [Deltaproteobacteria bacterium]|mgnify:CR=1 FL=1|jgi:hypothetical protein|nr:hypothetical protein [Deltaproteobacteria bacterium]
MYDDYFDKLNSDGINEITEKNWLIKELQEISIGFTKEFCMDSAISLLVSDALDSENINELRMAKAAIDSLPDHIKENLKTDWAILSWRPEYKEILENLIHRGDNKRYFKISSKWNQDTEKEEINGKIVFELLQTNSLVTVYVQEGTSKEEALDFLKKAVSELEDSWHLVSDPDQYQGYMD